MPCLAKPAIRCIIALLIGLAAIVYGHGLSMSWLRDSDGDMEERLVEYSLFRKGVYPTAALEPTLPENTLPRRTVYPPYALPMFALFFEPGGKIQGRILIQVLSLTALAAIGTYGFRLLRPAGREAAVVGALAAIAIPGNGTALAVGQFSIVCVGCILFQMLLLERGRPLAAGACWAIAMLKPQVGLTFAALFLVRREWRGLAFGLAILVGLSLVACWWTEVSPWAVIDYWVFRMNMRFAATTSLSGQLAAAAGVNPRIFHIGIAVLLMLLPLVALSRRSTPIKIEDYSLTIAAVAGLLGSLFLYHRAYDHIMIFPLLFLVLLTAAKYPTPRNLAIAAAMGVSLWVPQKLLQQVPLEWLARPAVWVACSVAFIASQRASLAPGPTPHSAG